MLEDFREREVQRGLEWAGVGNCWLKWAQLQNL
eukprot:CAMPEP_0174282554 /NCGR_PEP_ID=MMETSP0809-20121228/3073_1 /TAXON_ID=73025 ORGANISM="Eutreptiella gymnastica-like, Strain CCMP1594" /NCGR_SAMPLE_ID=MMETSP0809 /ASSEMBLY_ACC=CAM_ASM_000658 /LENGTH=32 /DNA_ID= /DNA_START= /DNA_END= /DNA_ORIENTATION=